MVFFSLIFLTVAVKNLKYTEKSNICLENYESDSSCNAGGAGGEGGQGGTNVGDNTSKNKSTVNQNAGGASGGHGGKRWRRSNFNIHTSLILKDFLEIGSATKSEKLFKQGPRQDLRRSKLYSPNRGSSKLLLIDMNQEKLGEFR